MAGKVAELRGKLEREGLAQDIAYLWDDWNKQRSDKRAEWRELRNFLFATDTTKTSNNALPWKNKTTLPKLTQIRDNLHANYISALFPNDAWMKWEAYTKNEEEMRKRKSIQGYMSNKTREGNMRTTISKLLLDYIDYGNAFADVEYASETAKNKDDELVQGYVGPRIRRISPNDIVFNPTAVDFESSPKIERIIKTIGEVKRDLKNIMDNEYYETLIKRMEEIRNLSGSYSVEDFEKAFGYTVDGFGNLYDYYQSPYVEILEFEGDLHDSDSGTLYENYKIVVIDRAFVVLKEPLPSWSKGSTKMMVTWRERPDNLWGMGPLDNLVGMQYRIDHLENLKADVFDLIAFPPLKIMGDVEEFEWAPMSRIHIDDEASDVNMMAPDTRALQADTQIALLQQQMEEFAGAPRQAMGIRTPGEKTAFEVSTLQNAAGRIFQEKITNFEINLLEPLLNSMLEVARRNLDGEDIVRVTDDDFGVQEFLKITKADITAKGKLRPVGARHFAAKAQLTQNLMGIANSAIWQDIKPHISNKKLAAMIEEILQFEKYDLVQDNVGIMEQAETARLTNQVAADLQQESMVEMSGEQPMV